MEALVIDIGGTKTNISIITGSKETEIKILKTETIPTTSNPDHMIQRISSFYKGYGKRINDLSLSLPGKWTDSGILKESINLKTWIDFPFIELLKKELNIEICCFESDVICGAIGEHNALGGTDLLYINMGTGIGMSLIKDGKPFKSKKDLILRLHKMVLPYGDEIYSSTDLLSGASIIQDTNFNSCEELFKEYKTGTNIEVIDLISKAQTQLAAWLINLYYLFAPEIIVLNGGLANDFEVLCEGAIEIANEELEDAVEILPSKLKELAPIYGAFLNLYSSRQTGASRC